ncbi:MAG: hypothetical protein Alpg2KO_20970 [Alphaproteobacteria bacterium]
MPNSFAETATSAAGGLITGTLRTAYHMARQVVLQGAAWSLIITGLIVPFVPVPVAVVGGYMLARESAATRRFLAKMRTRWPGSFDQTIDFCTRYSPRFAEDIDRLTGIEHLTHQRSSGPERLADAVISPIANLSLSIDGRRIGFSAFKPRNYRPRLQEPQAGEGHSGRGGAVPDDLVRQVAHTERKATSAELPAKSPIAAHPRAHIRYSHEVDDASQWRPRRRGPADGDKIIEGLRKRGFKP